MNNGTASTLSPGNYADAPTDNAPLPDDPDNSHGSQPQPYTIWAPSKFLNYEIDPSSSLIGNGVVEKSSWTSFIGIGGLGKTRLALWLSICQITGREWCGLPSAPEPQVILFLSTENGCKRWKTDLQKIYTVLSGGERAAVEHHLRILALTDEEDGDLCLSNESSIVRLTLTLKEQQPGIVIFDPFADMVAGDENKNTDVIATLKCLRQIVRRTVPNAAGIIIHHARTGADNVKQAGDNYNAGNMGRGGKALYSAVRSEIQLVPGDRDDSSRLVLACGKANDAPKFTTRGIIFDPETFTYAVDPDFNIEAWRADVDGKQRGQSVSVADVVEVVRDLCPNIGDSVQTGKIVAEVRARHGGSERTIKDRLKEAVKAGYLRKEQRGEYRLGRKSLHSNA